MVQLAREISEVKRSEDSRRRNLSRSEKKNVTFEAEILKGGARGSWEEHADQVHGENNVFTMRRKTINVIAIMMVTFRGSQ